MKRIFVVLCIMSLVLNQMAVPAGKPMCRAQETQKKVGAGSEVVFRGDIFEITYRIDSAWSGAYNASVSIKNTGKNAIENWALLFYDEDEIKNIWNGKQVNNDCGLTMIKNAEWNQDIPANGSVNFGFTAEYEDFICLPKSFALSTRKYKVNAENYTVKFIKDSDWVSGYTARVELENHSEAPIEDWEMEFTFPYGIDNLWGGTFSEKAENIFCVRNSGWNQNINKSQSVSFGFSGAPGNIKEDLSSFTVYAYTTDVDETLDSDGDQLSNIDEIKIGTNPYQEDTDGDNLSDYLEIVHLGLNPLKMDTDDNGVMDGEEDTDEDGLINLLEIKMGLEPWNQDTDYDGFADGEEVNKYHTNPLKEDTDGDTLLDGVETKLGFSPIKQDTDGNGIRDDKEMKMQKVEEEITDDNENDGAIRKVDVKLNVTGYAEENTEIENVYGEDMLSSEVEGLVGVPVNVTSSGNFGQATITFHYDKNKLGDTSEDDLAIMWYDKENDDYVIYDEESVLDKSKGTISYTTTHFSTYLVVNKKKWYKIWKNELNYRTSSYAKKNVDFVFTVDASKSMLGEEIKCTKAGLKEFAFEKRGKDRGCVIRFSDTIEVLQKLTKSSKKIKQAIDNIDISKGGGTLKGLKKAVSQFTSESYQDIGNRKVVLLICDGNLTYDEELVDRARENGIAICSILIGENNEDILKKMSKKTNGVFRKISAASQMTDALMDMQTQILGELNKKDSDGDGLYDVYETTGMLCANGKIVKTNAHKKDSDGDNLGDGKEMVPQKKKKVIFRKDTGEYIEAHYFTMKSNPLKKDSDGDEYTDDVDKNPMINDVKLIGIRQDADFLSIPLILTNAYGGNQNWWQETDKEFADEGCGIIAASNLIQYQNRKGKSVVYITSKEDYMVYTDDLRKSFNYLPYFGGTCGINLITGMKRFFKKKNLKYKVNLEPAVFSKKYNQRDKMLRKLEKAVKKKNPVIFSVGPTFPKETQQKQKVKMYESRVNGSLINIKNTNKYVLMYNHYVALTGILKDKQEDTIYFQVSSEGKKYYVDYIDICNYVDFQKTELTCDAIFMN